MPEFLRVIFLMLLLPGTYLLKKKDNHLSLLDKRAPSQAKLLVLPLSNLYSLARKT